LAQAATPDPGPNPRPRPGDQEPHDGPRARPVPALALPPGHPDRDRAGQLQPASVDQTRLPGRGLGAGV